MKIISSVSLHSKFSRCKGLHQIDGTEGSTHSGSGTMQMEQSWLWLQYWLWANPCLDFLIELCITAQDLPTRLFPIEAKGKKKKRQSWLDWNHTENRVLIFHSLLAVCFPLLPPEPLVVCESFSCSFTLLFHQPSLHRGPSTSHPPFSPFPCPFLSFCFHPSISPVVTPSSSQCFHPSLPYPSLCNQSCDWAVFTGSSQGPTSVTHSLYNYSPPLTLYSLALLWSDYRGGDRKHPFALNSLTHTHLTWTSPTPCCAPPAVAEATGRHLRLSQSFSAPGFSPSSSSKNWVAALALRGTPG